MQVIQETGDGVTIVNSDIGTIDYTSGTVKLSKFNVSTFIGADIVVSANPVDKTLNNINSPVVGVSESLVLSQEAILI